MPSESKQDRLYNTIINIDDNESNRYVKSRALRSAGYRVVEGSTGADAIRLARDVRPQLALIDVKLPDINGLEVCRILKADSTTASMMILLVSALAIRSEDKTAGLEEGADGYLVEPADPDELLAMVRALLRLYGQEQRLQSAFDMAELAAYSWNPTTGKLDCDHRLKQMWGLRSQSPIDFSVFIGAVHPTDRPMLQQALTQSIDSSGRRTLAAEFRVVGVEDKIERWVSIRGESWFGDTGKAAGFVGIAQEVTDRKQNEQTLKNNEVTLRAFAENLEQLVGERTQELVQSQDRLRALASELNLAEQRERQRLAAELHDYLGQLLSLSRIKLDLTKQFALENNLAKLIAEIQGITSKALNYTRTLVSQLSPPVLQEFGLLMALQWLADQMHERNLKVTLNSSETIPSLPEDEALLLFQSVRELLFNCIKHAHVHEATITLKEIDGSLHITVSDQGEGFDPLTVIPQSKRDDGQTGGFGLFSIRERMLSMGGRFELKTGRGKGTHATLVLPLKETATESTVRWGESPRVPPKQSAQEESSRLRVLVADDHAMVRQGLCGLLAQYDDIEVIGEAANGEEAVEMGGRLRPDIFLLDVTMPNVDGVEATRRIKHLFPAAVVIGLSVHNAPQIEKRIMEAGAAAFLSKEVAVDSLYKTIHAVKPRTRAVD